MDDRDPILELAVDRSRDTYHIRSLFFVKSRVD